MWCRSNAGNLAVDYDLGLEHMHEGQRERSHGKEMLISSTYNDKAILRYQCIKEFLDQNSNNQRDSNT